MLAENVLRVRILRYLLGVQIFTHIPPDELTFAVTESLVTRVHIQNCLALSVSCSSHGLHSFHTCRSLSTFKIETAFLNFPLDV